MNIIIKECKKNIDKNLQYREFNNVIGTYIDTTLIVPMRIIKFKNGSEIAFPVDVKLYVEV